MCEEAKMAVTSPHKRYNVNANKSMYFSGEFDTAEEAVASAAELIHEGYAVVSIRDNELDKDIW